MTIVFASQFHICLAQCLKCKSGSSRFQLGEGPSKGLLHDYESPDGPSFQALVSPPSPQYVLPVERHVQKLVHVFYTARAWVPPYAKLVLTGESVLVERDIRVWNSKTYRDKPVYLREDKLIVQHRK